MKAFRETYPLVVRPRRFLRRHLVVSLAAFTLTVAVVYSLSQYLFTASGRDLGSQAIAEIQVRPTTSFSNLPADCLFRSSLFHQVIRIRLKDQEFLTRILHDCDISIPSGAKINSPYPAFISAEQLWQGLHIRISPGAAPGDNRIILELKLTHSPEASRICQAVANEFVKEYRNYWASESHKAYLAASAQADQAQEVYRQASIKLQSLRQKQSGQTKYSLSDQELIQTNPVRQAMPQTTANPAWTDLNRQIEQLKKQEADLLKNKTPAHPDVKYVQDMIAELQQLLALTPRWDWEDLAENLSPQMVPSVNGKNQHGPNVEKNTREEDVAANEAETVETLNKLQEMIEHAGLAYQEKTLREKQAFDASRQEPIFSVQVRPLVFTQRERYFSKELLGITLFSGFFMAAGAGMCSSGAAVQPVLATIADLEPLLSVPIIGVAPDKTRAFNPIARRRRQTIIRRMLIVLGCLTIFGCMAGVSYFFAIAG